MADQGEDAVRGNQASALELPNVGEAQGGDLGRSPDDHAVHGVRRREQPLIDLYIERAEDLVDVLDALGGDDALAAVQLGLVEASRQGAQPLAATHNASGSCSGGTTTRNIIKSIEVKALKLRPPCDSRMA